MTHLIPIHLRSDLFFKMCETTNEGFFGAKTEAALYETVSDWLAKQHESPGGKPRSKARYQWKQLFLPEGTLLRITIKAQAYYATVEGNDIVSEGRRLSPSQFANAHGTVRNAWRVIWLRMPGEDWERAASRRDSL